MPVLLKAIDVGSGTAATQDGREGRCMCVRGWPIVRPKCLLVAYSPAPGHVFTTCTQLPHTSPLSPASTGSAPADKRDMKKQGHAKSKGRPIGSKRAMLVPRGGPGGQVQCPAASSPAIEPSQERPPVVLGRSVRDSLRNGARGEHQQYKDGRSQQRSTKDGRPLRSDHRKREAQSLH